MSLRLKLDKVLDDNNQYRNMIENVKKDCYDRCDKHIHDLELLKLDVELLKQYYNAKVDEAKANEAKANEVEEVKAEVDEVKAEVEEVKAEVEEVKVVEEVKAEVEEVKVVEEVKKARGRPKIVRNKN